MPSKAISTAWWKDPEGKKHTTAFKAFELIEKTDRTRRELDERHAKYYSGSDLRGLRAGEYFRISDPSRIALNIIASVIDTAHAKITKNRPRPQFLTDGAEWSMRRRAKDLGRWSEGLLYEIEAYEQGPKCFLDAEITGTAAFKVFREGKKICGERTYPWELHVDPVEAYYGKPRQLFHERLIDRAQLAALYPKHEKAIAAEKRHGETESIGASQSQADFIRVLESWHLSSGPKAKDGAHLVAISGATLHEEDWKRPRFPFAFLRWTERPVGFWGQGIAERLTGIQYEINVLLQKFQEIYAIWGKPWMMLERGSKVKKSHITDELDTVLEYTGVKPTLEVFQLVSPEMYNHLLWLISRAYEEVGVSLLSATSKKPAGVDAAVALRELNDIESERFLPQGRAYEEFFMDITRLGIEEAREIPQYRVRAPEKRNLHMIRWGDVDLDDDSYVMRVYPTSALPSTPVGRRQEIAEWIKMGLPADEGMRLMEIPDLEAYRSRKFAGYDVVDEMIEQMLDDGEEHVPEPYMPLEYALQQGQDAYNYGKVHRAPVEHLELLQRWMSDCEALIQKRAAAAPVAGGAAPALPPGVTPPQLPPTAGVTPPPGTPIQ